MTQMLENNKFILQQITMLSNLMMNLSSCVNFNRYRTFNSIEELEKQAEKLGQNRELYASEIMLFICYDLGTSKTDYSLIHLKACKS